MLALIHDGSPRADEPFVAVNCGAIPEALLESELFGHVRGAFTGANARQAASSRRPMAARSSSTRSASCRLRCRSSCCARCRKAKSGASAANTSKRVDVRVIAATNRDLAADVNAGRFRGDLYYRLNVVSIRLPPLRERREDIPELALHLLRRHNARLGLEVGRISPEAMRLLAGHAWPGNVRELENVIERALVMASGPTIEAAHLVDLSSMSPAAATNGAVDVDLSVKRRTETLERTLIQRALEQTRGNRTRAAQLLELSHRALLYKIRDYGLGD